MYCSNNYANWFGRVSHRIAKPRYFLCVCNFRCNGPQLQPSWGYVVPLRLGGDPEGSPHAFRDPAIFPRRVLLGFNFSVFFLLEKPKLIYDSARDSLHLCADNNEVLSSGNTCLFADERRHKWVSNEYRLNYRVETRVARLTQHIEYHRLEERANEQATDHLRFALEK